MSVLSYMEFCVLPITNGRIYNKHLYKNNKKTFPIKMKEDLGMSKPKKHVNKVRWDPKLNKLLPYNPT